MKKKLALLMAAIMTVAMVPMTAFASTKVNVFDLPIVSEDGDFSTIVEVKKDNSQTNVEGSGYVLVSEGNYVGGTADPNNSVARPTFQVKVTLSNGEFTKEDKPNDDNYVMQEAYKDGALLEDTGVADVKVQNSKTAIITLDAATFNQANMDAYYGEDATVETDPTDGTACEVAPLVKACAIEIFATALDAGTDVTAAFARYSGRGFTSVTATIAEVSKDKVSVDTEGVVTFVEDSDRIKELKDVMIEGLVNGAIKEDHPITLKLSGNYKFNISAKADNANGYVKYGDKDSYTLLDKNDGIINASTVINTLNSSFTGTVSVIDDDEIVIVPTHVSGTNVVDIMLSGICLKADKSASAGDKATIRVSSKDFTAVKLEVARMVEEAVTYTVEDDDLPRLWAGQKPENNQDNDGESLSIFIEENTGDILNTSRKATFTFPEGIEVAAIEALDGVKTTAGDYRFKYEIDQNVVTIWNYGEDGESDKTDMEISFILSAAPTFEGDVNVTLGGEFDDVELKVATVKAPYTVEAKTTEVLIDYRYVPVNEIVITEAEDGLLEDDDVILLQVEKMDFEDAGTYEVTSGDIDVDVTINDGDADNAQLVVEVKDSSTEASTITISGLELYLDRTLPVGGYALQNVMEFNDGLPAYDGHTNILWENSSNDKEIYDADEVTGNDAGDKRGDATFKYKAVTVNDSYVEVVTQARDQDDSTTNRKIVITIGATTMAVGTETITLDTPAYINAENYTELPLRAVSEAFGATVNWDDASRTVTIMMGQRIVSMTIGSKTMYINGTPVAMNTAPEITNERTFVPVRDLANALGISKIDWNEASATVTLN